MQESRSAATRGALIAVARTRFAEVGYHQANTTELVAMAEVTRGALYHHFADKKALFEAVFQQVSEEMQQRIDNVAVAHDGSRWDKTLAAFKAHLRLRADDREAQRILMIDGPVVLGWERWNSFQSELLTDLTRVLSELMDLGLIIRLPSKALAHQIIAVLNDAASFIAHSKNPAADLSEYTEVIEVIFRGLRPHGG